MLPLPHLPHLLQRLLRFGADTSAATDALDSFVDGAGQQATQLQDAVDSSLASFTGVCTAAEAAAVARQWRRWLPRKCLRMRVERGDGLGPAIGVSKMRGVRGRGKCKNVGTGRCWEAF